MIEAIDTVIGDVSRAVAAAGGRAVLVGGYVTSNGFQTVAGATITAPSAMLADGLATAVMTLGQRAGTELLGRFAGCEGLFITKDQDLTATSGFALG